MKPVLMEAIYSVFHRGVKKVKNALIPCILMITCVPVLCGCGTTRYASAPLVPPPPVMTAQVQEPQDTSFLTAVYYAEEQQSRVYNFAQMRTVSGPEVGLAAAARPELAGLPSGLGYERERVALSASSSKPDCSVKDRFDRGEVLAYEWDRSRVGVDVGGINLDSDGEASVKVKYSLRLQPEKTDEQKCRYPSQWQGIAGSAYNELVLRETDTVWEELRQMRKNVQNMF